MENAAEPQEPATAPPPGEREELKDFGHEEDNNGESDAKQSFHAPAGGDLFLCGTGGSEEVHILAFERLSTGH